jgi:hypothetical protein
MMKGIGEMAHLTDRIREKIDGLQALQIARHYREYAERSADPEVRRLAEDFLECEIGLQAIINGEVSYV